MTHKLLDQACIDHALIGGLALGAFGVQRFTNDIDWLVHGDERFSLKSLFLAHGFVIEHESDEVLQYSGVGNVDFLLANRPLSQAMLTTASEVPGFPYRCVLPEDFIALKIQAYCNNSKRTFQDKADIQAVMQSIPSLDWAKIEKYALIFEQWEEILEIRGMLDGEA